MPGPQLDFSDVLLRVGALQARHPWDPSGQVSTFKDPTGRLVQTGASHQLHQVLDGGAQEAHPASGATHTGRLSSLRF